MPYVSPKSVLSTPPRTTTSDTMRDSDKQVDGLSDALAGAHLADRDHDHDHDHEHEHDHAATRVARQTQSNTRNNSTASTAGSTLATVAADLSSRVAPSLGTCGADSSSSVNTVNSGSPAPEHNGDCPVPAPITPTTTEALSRYSQSVYAFTMQRYNEARDASARRTKKLAAQREREL